MDHYRAVVNMVRNFRNP